MTRLTIVRGLFWLLIFIVVIPLLIGVALTMILPPPVPVLGRDRI